MNKPNVSQVFKCKCDLITVNFDNGAWNTMKESTFIKRVGELPKDIISSYCCDGCSLNNYTIENKKHTLFQIKKSALTWK